MDDANCREDFVDLAAEGKEHALGMGEVGGFADDGAVEGDERVGCEDEGVGMEGFGCASFGEGVGKADVGGMAVGLLGGVGGVDEEIEAGLPEELLSAARC